MAKFGTAREVCFLFGLYCADLPERLGPHEIAWCRMLGIDCVAAKTALELAEEISGGVPRSGDPFDPDWNARHHGLWMAILVAQGISPDDARLLAVAHELDGPRSGAPTYGSTDSRIDMRNNEMGIKIGLAAREKVENSPDHPGLGEIRGGEGQMRKAAEAAIEMVMAAVDAGGCSRVGCFDMSRRG
ncbi:hypothetical protein Voc01_026060 [Virgisporangium ochraceum]|uniref:Uncharacterized protein n=1 Tax=Virgisporangium ochraceum TaxID=65505 RepID=A0A8J4EAM3_9ACTN|nr:hypothetical protein Voc01_026060 [Virgisporangium ochraceum]